jgi:hypothetical protein
MHQNHIEFTFRSKLQHGEGMEKISICKTFVEQTSKQQAQNVLLINSNC